MSNNKARMNTNQIIIISAGIMAAMVVFGLLAVQYYANNTAEKQVNRAIAEMSPVASATYKSARVNLLGMAVTVKDVKLHFVGQNEEIAIDRVIVSRIDDENEFPRYLHARLEDIEFRPASVDNDLSELGYDHIRASLELDYRLDPASGDFSIKTLKITGKEMGEIEMDLAVTEFRFDPNKMDAGLLFITLPGIQIKNAGIEYKDKSLVKRLIRVEAKKHRKTEAAYLQKLTQDIDGDISREKDPLAVESLMAFKAFINDPDRIALSVAPDHPVPVSRILNVKNSAEFIKIMNLKISS